MFNRLRIVLTLTACSCLTVTWHGKTLSAQGNVLIQTRQSGAWSDPKTWEGEKVPAAAARVQIRRGHTVTYDRNPGPPIRFIHIAGTLTFSRTQNTTLEVGLIAIQPGDDAASEGGFHCDSHAPDIGINEEFPALEIGTPQSPLDAAYAARIRLRYFTGQDRASCPAIVCCGGRMDFHGAPLSDTWLKLGADAKAGTTAIVLAKAVSGWKKGDRIIVTASAGDREAGGTRRPGAPNRAEVETEERFVQAIDGTSVVLDRPLRFFHSGSGDYRSAVANLSRNVIIESADPAGPRGHTMYHLNSAGAISYAEFRHLGKENVLGRYSIHFHLCRSSMRGSYVQGASIWDSHNRWVTIHGTNYMVVRDCVGYQSVGHGFFLEDGTEVFNVLDHNLAVQAYAGKKLPKQALPFDENDGAGIWWANSQNSFTRNATCENDRYGFRYEATPGSGFRPRLPVLQPSGSRRDVDIRSLPFVCFEGNESACDGRYGINLGEGVDGVGPDKLHPFVLRETTIWNVHYAFRPQTPSVVVEGMKIWHADYGIYTPHYDGHYYKDLYIGDTQSEPFNRGLDDDSLQHGLLVVDGLTFDRMQNSVIPMIQISDTNATGRAESHFRNVKVINRADKGQRALVNLGGSTRPEPRSANGVPVYLHDWYGPGKAAKIVSIKSRELRADGLAYRQDPPLTGDASRAAVATGIAFPPTSQPPDDMPPATVITYVEQKGKSLLVRGTTSDNGTVRRVTVGGKEAAATKPNFTQWEVTLTDLPAGSLRLTAFAEDEAGNVEQNPHRMLVEIKK
jgi:hypothetical protein